MPVAKISGTTYWMCDDFGKYSRRAPSCVAVVPDKEDIHIEFLHLLTDGLHYHHKVHVDQGGIKGANPPSRDLVGQTRWNDREKVAISSRSH